MPEQKPSPSRGKVDANAVSRRMRVQTSSSYREILSREKAILENPQIFQNCEIKIIFPLNMRKATRSAFKIVYPQNRYKENPWNL